MKELVDFLKQRYIHYLEKDPDQEWLGRYKSICNDTIHIAQNLTKNPIRDQDSAMSAIARSFNGSDQTPEGYLREIWYDRSNRIATIGQGGIAQTTFANMKQDVSFWPPFINAIQLAQGQPDEPAITGAYNQLIQWMQAFSQRENVSNFSAVVNRVVAACLPGRVSSIAAEGRLNDLLTALNAWPVYTALIDGVDNTWLSKNRFLLTTLETAMSESHPANDTPHRRSIFFWWLYEHVVSDDARQIILYGSPGTGKTHAAKARAESGIKSWQGAHANEKYGKKETIQFHPSFTYENFIEGIRPSKEDNGPLSLKLVPGLFKRFCFEAAEWEIDFLRSSKRELDEDTKVTDLANGKKDTPLWGFLRNVPQEDRIIDHLPPYYFIIDEINRAELSRVLGETMLALEYRGAKDRILTQYSYLCTDEAHEAAFLMEGKENYFFIPYNIRVIGTMNVIDRSVEAFDLALRRRFRWEELTFDEDAVKSILSGKTDGYITDAISHFKNLNNCITQSPLLGKDYIIGHAYAKRLTDYRGPGGIGNARQFVWQNHLEPLLREYLRGAGQQNKIIEEIAKFRRAFHV
jgi:5-methylcytosine-specific restriction protein B